MFLDQRLRRDFSSQQRTPARRNRVSQSHPFAQEYLVDGVGHCRSIGRLWKIDFNHRLAEPVVFARQIMMREENRKSLAADPQRAILQTGFAKLILTKYRPWPTLAAFQQPAIRVVAKQAAAGKIANRHHLPC